MKNISKEKLEIIDKKFERKVWIDRNYEYDPIYRYKKFYIILKNEKIKRYGVNKILGTNVVNTADFILFSQKAREFKIKDVKFHHGTNFINKYDPLFFYFDKIKKHYTHLKYNQVYEEDDIQNLYSYSYNDAEKILYIRENSKIIKEIYDVYYYEFNDKNQLG